MGKRTYTRGEIGKVRVVKDFLPPPEMLVLRETDVKVTLSLSQCSVDFFQTRSRQTTCALPTRDPGIDGCVCGERRGRLTLTPIHD
jgi:hypothetical protein